MNTMNKELKVTTTLKLTILAFCLFYTNQQLQVLLLQFFLMVVASAVVLDGLEIEGERAYIIIESLVDVGVGTIFTIVSMLLGNFAIEPIFVILTLTTFKMACHWFELVPFKLRGVRRC